MSSNFYTIISHPIEGKILLMPAGDGWTLPVHNPTHTWTPQIELETALPFYLKKAIERLGQ